MRINKLLFLALLIPSIALAEMPKEDTVKGVKDHPLLHDSRALSWLLIP